jgi:hypothetical protein
LIVIGSRSIIAPFLGYEEQDNSTKNTFKNGTFEDITRHISE